MQNKVKRINLQLIWILIILNWIFYILNSHQQKAYYREKRCV
jgi:hypothetical protein